MTWHSSGEVCRGILPGWFGDNFKTSFFHRFYLSEVVNMVIKIYNVAVQTNLWQWSSFGADDTSNLKWDFVILCFTCDYICWHFYIHHNIYHTLTTIKCISPDIFSSQYLRQDILHNSIMSMAQYKTAVSLLLMHWRCCSIALTHRYMIHLDRSDSMCLCCWVLTTCIFAITSITWWFDHQKHCQQHLIGLYANTVDFVWSKLLFWFPLLWSMIIIYMCTHLKVTSQCTVYRSNLYPR